MSTYIDYSKYLEENGQKLPVGYEWDPSVLEDLKNWYEDPYHMEPEIMKDELPANKYLDQYNQNPENPQYDDTFHELLEKLQKTAEDAAFDLIRTKKPSEMTPAEKRARYLKYKQWKENSPAPDWYKNYVVPTINTLDDTQDIIATAAALARLAAIIPGPQQAVTVPIAGLLSGASLLLDIPTALLSLAGGPTGLKKLIEAGAMGKRYLGKGGGRDIGGLAKRLVTDPKLEQALQKRGMKRIAKALPGIGDILQAGQALETLTGKGLVLGPLMGKISDLWWSGIRKIQPGWTEPGRTKPPARGTLILGDTKKGIKDLITPEQVWYDDEVEDCFVYTLDYPDPAWGGQRLKRDTVAVTGLFRRPTPAEYQALKLWEKVAYDLVVPGGMPMEIIWEDLIALAHAMPIIMRFLQVTDWHILAGAVAHKKMTPTMHVSAWAGNRANEEGISLPLWTEPLDRKNQGGMTYYDWFMEHRWSAAYHLWCMKRQLHRTWQGLFLDMVLGGLGCSFLHMLTMPACATIYEDDPSAPFGYKPKTAGISGYTLTPPLDYNLVRRFNQWGMKAPSHITDADCRAFIECYMVRAKVLEGYPKFKDVRECAYEYLGGFRFKENNKFYHNDDEFHADFPYIP